MSETQPKRMVNRSVAVALGIICIILIVSLVGAFEYYTILVADKDKTISSLDSELSNVIGNYSDYRLLKMFTVVAQNQTVTATDHVIGGYVGYEFFFPAPNSGYVSVTINDSTENPTTVRLMHFNLGYTFQYDLETPIGATSRFPVTGVAIPNDTIVGGTAIVWILFKNPVLANDQATVTIAYYY